MAIGSSEVMDLFCHIISQGHVIKVSCNFMVEASQAKVATGSGSEDKIFLACHVILQDHITKWPCHFMVRSPLT